MMPIGAPAFGLERLGVVMSPLAGEPTEALGVLNPATARRGAEVYLFPRLVAEGNYSRIGRARGSSSMRQGSRSTSSASGLSSSRRRPGGCMREAAGSRTRGSPTCRGSAAGS